ncbi:MAG: hypothetical protein ABIQ95_00630 [Bdellovibrionia bacterium]
MKKITFLVCMIGAIGTSALRAESENKPVESKKASKVSTEQRQKMAERHEKMASCLRSERPMSECHQEMMKDCKNMMGEGGCPMMDQRKGHEMHNMMDKKDSVKE